MRMTTLSSILALVASCSAFAESFEEKKAIWMSSNQPSIEHHLSHGDESVTLPIVNTLISIWIERDGATSSEISPILARSIINEPKLTFLSFNEHKESYQNWLGELQGALFTDYEGNQSEELQSLHEELLTSLEEYIDSEPDLELKDLALALQRRLEKLSVRVVD
ncbi:hypothetical protein [Vibrio nigripulchritudo]|uniref:hypothetical protein n=1 Tax=Vibrio nigripulchritudo TaxID=28173 RepID=UPI0003B1E550|nr:hypothetical protein [Vibrio nigripulchritudo]CCN68935.1 exported hypothetical protein [Vibrio nigripulchritudo SFn118]